LERQEFLKLEGKYLLPMPKQAASDKLVSKIDGPTFPRARPMWFSIDSVFFLSKR